MIEATYRALAPTQVQERLQIKVSELDVFQNNFTAVNTTAALIGGFAFTGVTSVGWDDGTSPTVKVAFYVTSVLCIASSLHSVIVSTAATVMAPDLAMRGGNPETNISRALEGSQSVLPHIYVPFGLGIALFQATLMVLSVNALGFSSWATALGSGGCLLVFVGALATSVAISFQMKRRFEKDDVDYGQSGYMPLAN
eukprot:TRINITY_DN24659_c0_g1_i1.p2 TRINITY_DN24659_c0_g1~~TRINITY_DN24659_c0_g1_i1.p2  ORF type:complete len:223 (+),score=102.42 TRINITY_DN24659_c0_g1_i1:79-669(+)